MDNLTIDKATFESAVPAFKSAGTEVFNKVQHALAAVTSEWEAIITTDAQLTEAAQHHLATAICLRAAHQAVPQMDLVLTPTGFGIVSNQNTAPASRERVTALSEQLRHDACRMEDAVLAYLAHHDLMTMRRSRVSSLLWTPTLCTLYGIRTTAGGEIMREEFDAIQTQLHAASARVVDVISPELYAELVKYQYAAPGQDDELLEGITIKARQFMAAHVMQRPDHAITRQLINAIEANADKLPEYQQSATYQARHTPRYENKQDDASFFFG